MEIQCLTQLLILSDCQLMTDTGKRANVLPKSDDGKPHMLLVSSSKQQHDRIADLYGLLGAHLDTEQLSVLCAGYDGPPARYEAPQGNNIWRHVMRTRRRATYEQPRKEFTAVHTFKLLLKRPNIGFFCSSSFFLGAIVLRRLQ